MSLVYIMSAICSFCVANIYYNQPILMLLTKSFNISQEQIGNIPTINQISYAIGLLFLVPLGDKLNRKKLLQILLSINLIASLIMASCNSFYLFEIMNFFIGLTSIGAQIIIPSIPSYVDKKNQGKAVGILLSGLVTGILFARLFSGFIGGNLGWRAVFYISSCIDLGIITFITCKFPSNTNNTDLNYTKLLRSTIYLFLYENKLRLSCLSGFLIFGAYSALWGSIAYLTSLEPFYFTSEQVGLLGLSGIAGIIISPYVGKLADKYNANFVVITGSIISLCGFIIMFFSIQHIIILILSMILLDISARHSIIGNQLRIFAIDIHARSRLNTAFMTSYFLGGACGTKLGNMLGMIYGWYGLIIIGILASSFTIIINKFIFKK